MKFKWRCTKCGDEVESDDEERHQMDWCKCGKTAIDLEKFYCRTVGFPEPVEE